MQFRFNFQGLPKSEALCNYTQTQLRKHLTKFFGGSGVTEVHFSQSGGGFAAIGQLEGSRAFRLRAKASADNPYSAAHVMVLRLAEQIRRLKDRRRRHHAKQFEHHNQNSVPVSVVANIN